MSSTSFMHNPPTRIMQAFPCMKYGCRHLCWMHRKRRFVYDASELLCPLPGEFPHNDHLHNHCLFPPIFVSTAQRLSAFTIAVSTVCSPYFSGSSRLYGSPLACPLVLLQYCQCLITMLSLRLNLKLANRDRS